MESPEEALRRSNLLDTTPETDTYAILGFLCAHRESTVTPAAIAEQTGCPKSTVVKVLNRLEALGAVEQVTDEVQVDTGAAEIIAQRLKSLDAVTRMFNSAPNDRYASVDWVSQVGSIDDVNEDEE